MGTGRDALEYLGAAPMDSEHLALVIKTRELIKHSRYEISQLREELQSAWNTVDQSQRLLSRVDRQRRSSPFASIRSKAFKNTLPS
jgi:hypothetical protein